MAINLQMYIENACFSINNLKIYSYVLFAIEAPLAISSSVLFFVAALYARCYRSRYRSLPKNFSSFYATYRAQHHISYMHSGTAKLP